MDNWGIYNYIKAKKGGGSGDNSTLDALIDRSLTSINNNRVTIIGGGAFENCAYLTTAVFPSALKIGTGAFTRCSGLTTTFFPLVTTLNGNAFNACTSLAAVDFPLAAAISDRAFVGCTSLTVCILRAQSVCTLAKADAFGNTPIIRGTGYIYVPDNLVNDYKAATNWTVYAEQIKGLSQLPEGV